MTLRRLILRNLFHYWRTNLAVIAGVATAVAVLSGALLVGQSVRASLRDLLFQRLGATDYVVSADRFFREELAAAFKGGSPDASCPIIYVPGVLIHEATGSRALEVNVFGVDERFWQFQGIADPHGPVNREALVGAALAQRLGARPGDGLLLRIETQQGIPKESLYGRRENPGRTIRLHCSGILPPERLGEFALRPSQGTVYSVFVPLERLQQDLKQAARVNAVLIARRSQAGALEEIRKQLTENFDLSDVGVKLRPLPAKGGISFESTRVLLDDAVAQAAMAAAAESRFNFSGIFTYLANAIRAGGREIPYSVVTAADLGQGTMTHVRGFGPSPLGNASDAIWFNDWAARDLGVHPGEPVDIDYYLWQPDGRLSTQTAHFRLAGVLEIGGDLDATLAPEFPGISDTRSIREWDPPFPLDLRRIRPQDEEYWRRYRATPKAIIPLARGQELWQSRFGKLTAVRIAQQGPEPDYRSRIHPEAAGFTVAAVRQRGLEASQGSTDFGEYFVYFSFFLTAAALLLATLFFRLGLEQRVREIGILQALGFPKGTQRHMFLIEGAILSITGSALGLLGAVGYGGLLVFGLRTWWVGAVGTRRLFLHLSWSDLGLGAAAGVLIAIGVIAWTLRGLHRNSPRALLAGVLESAVVRVRRVRALGAISAVAFLAALCLLIGSFFNRIGNVEGFFGAGFLLLVSFLAALALYLRQDHPGPIRGRGWKAYLLLGTKNAMHRPGRSLLCIALIASATFIIISVEAFRQNPSGISLAPESGTGGFALIAESAIPIVHDPNSVAGREALGMQPSEARDLARVKFVPFRERPGDDTSCLNLYAPLEPRILGARHSFLADARFSFQDSLAVTEEQKRNPWLLLESVLPDGAIPAIGDANTVQYILHLALGGELTVQGSGGKGVRLRIVAMLRDSTLQGELTISEGNFLRAFPSQEGFRFFLLEAPPDEAASLVQPLMERLGDWGFKVETSGERLAAYHRVENTYLSTFQLLGALGLILGTVGLATVLLRNVLERRSELALLRAVGYSRQALASIIVAENAALMICGLACGTLCALLSIVPALTARGGAFPVITAGLILCSVLAAGLASSLLAVIAALRSPLLAALRSE
jgi:putative ABC transport system permease protein